MGFYSQQIKVVQIDPENSVTIRRLTFGESQQVISESTVFDIISETANLDFAKNQAAKMRLGIVSWEGPGFEGREVNAENISDLPSEVGRVILQAIDALGAGLTGEDQKK